MKKTIYLALVFVFIFSLALQLPVLAEESNETATNTPILISTRATTTATSSLEKIPSPEYIRYFREIKKVDGVLYGLKKPADETEKFKITDKATTTLEKIPSPAFINLYNHIKKVGNDLFGIKKASSTIANITKNDEKKMAEMKKAGLEKISSLEHLSFFERVTKVGNDLFGLRKKGVIIVPEMTPEKVTCTAAAIDAKDTSINISLTNSTTEITAAIDARGICQKAALSLTSNRKEAVKTCNTTFQTATKTAHEKARNAQKAAWETYKNSLKSCSPTLNIEDGGEILS